MKFKAVILEKINKPLVIKEIETTPLKRGQVLVKNLVSGLCGAQLQEIRGEKGNAKFVPHLLGHEGCGIVQEVGEDVTNVKVGDKVVMHWRKGNGIESDFPEYIIDGNKKSSGKITTLSEYSIISENRSTSVPIDTPDDFCALLGCAITTAYGVVNDEINWSWQHKNNKILIIGIGGVGLNIYEALMSYCLFKGGEITCLDKFDKNDIKTIKSLSETNSKFDVIIDTTGNSELISESLKYLNDNGQYIIVSQINSDLIINKDIFNSMFSENGKTIKFSQGGKSFPSYHVPHYIKMQKEGELSYEKIITHKFDMNEINEAIELLKTGNCGRIMIKIN